VLEVVGVKPMNLQPWTTIAALRSFRVEPVGEPRAAAKGAFRLPSR
jgi:hypothetical protein